MFKKIKAFMEANKQEKDAYTLYQKCTDAISDTSGFSCLFKGNVNGLVCSHFESDKACRCSGCVHSYNNNAYIKAQSLYRQANENKWRAFVKMMGLVR